LYETLKVQTIKVVLFFHLKLFELFFGIFWILRQKPQNSLKIMKTISNVKNNTTLFYETLKV